MQSANCLRIVSQKKNKKSHEYKKNLIFDHLRQYIISGDNSLQSLCRACLCIKPQEMHPLLSSKDTTLAEMFTALTAIQVDLDDGLPMYICSNCRKSITNCYEFKTQCENANDTLKSILKEKVISAMEPTCINKGTFIDVDIVCDGDQTIKKELDTEEIMEHSDCTVSETPESHELVSTEPDYLPSRNISERLVNEVENIYDNMEIVKEEQNIEEAIHHHLATVTDVDIDLERDFMEPGEGSDVEHEDHDIALNPRNVNEYPVDANILSDPSLAEALRSIDAEADLALRTVIHAGHDQDLLNFDWRCEPENFEGFREVFSVPSTGPIFENAELTPLEVFLKIWDAEIIAHIVRETNRYSHDMFRRSAKPNSRLRRWKDVTDDDIKIFFAIIMLQSLVINNVEREYWYPKLDQLKIGDFRAIMPYNRFLEIKRCLHFVDNASLPVHCNRLDKIMPVIEHLNKKFSSLYVLEQNIAIEESLLLWKGRLTLSQKIATKKARVGIKSYELCESRTGYLWRMELYSGKGHVHVAQVGAQEPVPEHEEGYEPEAATSQIVLTVTRPLFNRGHTLVMDNFYNAPLLSRILKVKHKTDSMGTLRLNREFVPESLKEKAKTNMKTGEVAFSSTKDLNVVVWMDKNLVALISTFHQVKVGGNEKYGNYKYKPQVIVDYNLSMGGIDHKNQMLHAFAYGERVRNIIWYKKLFRRLFNVSIHNSFIMYNHNRTHAIGNREFRLQLAKELLQMCRLGALPRPLPPAAPAAPSQMHLPVKNDKPQRCKLCSAAKIRRTTVWRCSICAVNLCIEGCYTKYHNQLVAP